MFAALVRRWAEVDPRVASDWTSGLPGGPGRRAAVEQVAIAWANVDLPAAAGWAGRAMPEGDTRTTAILHVAYEAARAEPIVAVELASRLPATGRRDDLLVHALGQWASADAFPAASWAVEEEDPTSASGWFRRWRWPWRSRTPGGGWCRGARFGGRRRAGPGGGFRCATLGATLTRSRRGLGVPISGHSRAGRGGAEPHGLLGFPDAVAAGEWVHGLPAGPLQAIASAAHARTVARVPHRGGGCPGRRPLRGSRRRRTLRGRLRKSGGRGPRGAVSGPPESTPRAGRNAPTRRHRGHSGAASFAGDGIPRSGTDPEDLGDALGVSAFDDQLEDLALPAGQLLERAMGVARRSGWPREGPGQPRGDLRAEIDLRARRDPTRRPVRRSPRP